MTAGSAASHPIEFEQVTKRFGKRTVLSDLTFNVPEGTVVGLLGPNGAGKSTAMRVLLGLTSATAGQRAGARPGQGDRGFAAAVRRVGTIIEAPPLYRRLSPAGQPEDPRRRHGLLGQRRRRPRPPQPGRSGRARRRPGRRLLPRHAPAGRNRPGPRRRAEGRRSRRADQRPGPGGFAVEIRQLIKELPGRGVPPWSARTGSPRSSPSATTPCSCRRATSSPRAASTRSAPSPRSADTGIQVAPEALERAVATLEGLGLGPVGVTGRGDRRGPDRGGPVGHQPGARPAGHLPARAARRGTPASRRRSSRSPAATNDQEGRSGERRAHQAAAAAAAAMDGRRRSRRRRAHRRPARHLPA